MVTKLPVIAITGSTGKSTTKEMLASILKTNWKILETEGNKNLPLQIKQKLKQLKKRHNGILLELGMGRPGAARRHGRYVKPDIAVFTNIGTAHYGSLGNSIKETVRNKSMLLQFMNKKGLIVLNQDDDNSRLINTKKHAGPVITVGINKDADYRALNITMMGDRIEFDVQMDRSTHPFVVPVVGRHNVYNALFAIAVAHRLGFSIDHIQKGLAKFKSPIKRLHPYLLMGGSLLIDDTVNANMESMKAAINVMNEIGLSKRKVMVIGSMLELGIMSDQAHYEIGKYAALNGIDAVYTLGKETKVIEKGAIDAGMKKDSVHHFTSRHLLHRALKKETFENSVVMVKGSAGMKMSLTVEWIRARYYGYVSIRNNQQSDEIQVHPQMLQRLILKDDKMKIVFGNYSKSFPVKKNILIPRDCISVPRKLSDDLQIPDLKYESMLKKNELHIGPVIGFIVLRQYAESPEKQLIRFNSPICETGLFYLFRPEPEHRHRETIDGLYYDPKKRTFIKSALPLPSAIFNRTKLSSFMHQIYIERIGNKLFNFPYNNTDKWLLWTIASKHAALKKYFPFTVRYTGISPIHSLLKKYGGVYIKPRTLAGGSGIVSIRIENKKTVFISAKGQRWQIRSREQLRSLLKKHLVRNRSYIVQEAIPTDFAIGKVDFRAYMQKNDAGMWQLTGIESKIGMKGSIISNSKNRSMIMPGSEALNKIYGLDEERSRKFIYELRLVSIRLLKVLEEKHKLLGDVAIDFAVDRESNIRILEVQLNYAAEVKQFRSADERKVLPNILSKPFEFARYLAGFEP